MAKKKEIFTEEEIIKNRTFPTKNTVFLVICIIIQIALIVFAVLYNPQPIDIIKDYRVDVSPNEDGSLDIKYKIKWLALSEEPLTWVDIGLANENARMYTASPSDNISSYQLVTDDESGYVALRIYFDRGYRTGETVEFEFELLQFDMLCYKNGQYFYEFVPSWFNEIPVENYKFTWKKSGTTSANSVDTEDNKYIWSGSFGCGDYRKMQVSYGPDTFAGYKTAIYEPFDDEGAYDAIKESKIIGIVFAVVICIIVGIFEVCIVDSYVSYHKGRGFLSGYGHSMHIYGRTNPSYIRERDKHNASSGGRGGGRGCACACACACAGGGRAGCSQKDFYRFNKK